MIPNWDDFLCLSSEEELKILKRHEQTGRPVGNDSFVDKLSPELQENYLILREYQLGKI